MTDPVSALFADFDRGTISRRQLLQALGVAAVAAPMTAFGQGRCAAPLAGTPVCDTTLLPPPFEPTGWKTVLLDHFHLQVAEPEREAAFYQALMGWKVRSTEGGKIMMDIGDWGGVLIRGGLTPPTPPAAPPAGGDSAGRGRGRGGGGRRANWDGYCWGIEPWDTATVEAELKKRGLNPVADHAGDFKSFHVKDPDGMDVQISNGNRKNRRTTPATGTLAVAPPFESTGWKTVYLDHISFQVSSYKETVAFYKALLGWTSGRDEGSQANVTVAPEFGGLIIRGGNALAPGGAGASLWNSGRGGRGRGAADTAGGRGAAPPAVLPVVRGARMDHISFGIADFDYTKVLAELQKRGLRASEDTGGNTPIATASYKSYHTTTPNGFDLQIANKVSA
jgi:predicted enzyme related to lactoylglutathione lyase